MNKLHHFSRLAEWRKDMTASPTQTHLPVRTNELVVLRHLICGEYGCRIRQMCLYESITA